MIVKLTKPKFALSSFGVV